MASETNSRAFRFIIRKTRWDVPYAWQGYVSFCSWFVYPQQPDGRYYIRGIIQFKNPHRLSTLSRRYDSTAEWYPTRLGHESMKNEYILGEPRPGIEKYQYGTYYRFGVNIPMPNKHLPVVGLNAPPPLTLSQQFIAPARAMDSIGDDSFWWNAYDDLDRAHKARLPIPRTAYPVARRYTPLGRLPNFDTLYRDIDSYLERELGRQSNAQQEDDEYERQLRIDLAHAKRARKDPWLPRPNFKFDWDTPQPSRINKRKMDDDLDHPLDRIKFSRI